ENVNHEDRPATQTAPDKAVPHTERPAAQIAPEPQGKQIVAPPAPAADDDTAQTHLLRGTQAIANRQFDRGLAEYRNAIAIDPASREDAMLLRQFRALLANDKHALAAVRFLGTDVGRPACALLAEAASGHRRLEVRRAARAAWRGAACGSP